VNRQRGMSSLTLVLLLLMLGTLMLSGLNQKLETFSAQVSRERLSLQQQAGVQSALMWGSRQHWSLQTAVECKSVREARVCLRILDDGRAVMVAGQQALLWWRSGEVREGRLLLSPHGWSDFCPLEERALCQLP